MTFMPKSEVIDQVEDAGGRIVTIARDQRAGVLPSATYYVTRQT
jgi:hypothetical protein